MTNPEGPWRHNDPVPRSSPRLYIWLGIVAAIGLLVLGLAGFFPEIDLSGDNRYYLIYCVVALAGLAVGLSRRQFHLPTLARNVAIWVGIIAVLAVGYTLWNNSSGNLATRLQSELAPNQPVAADARTMVLTAGDDGDFAVVGAVNGARVLFAIDTGASDIVLSPADARRAGIDVSALRFLGETSTANGTGHVAYVHIASLAVGAARFDDIDVSVNQAPMDRSLLGMRFLRRLKSFEFEDRKLTLRLR